jgi:hypothetical protein
MPSVEKSLDKRIDWIENEQRDLRYRSESIRTEQEKVRAARWKQAVFGSISAMVGVWTLWYLFTRQVDRFDDKLNRQEALIEKQNSQIRELSQEIKDIKAAQK